MGMYPSGQARAHLHQENWPAKLRMHWRFRLLDADLPAEATHKPATNWHDGQITKSLSSPSDKNIPPPPSGKSAVGLSPSCPARGALAIVANEGQGAMDVRQ